MYNDIYCAMSLQRWKCYNTESICICNTTFVAWMIFEGCVFGERCGVFTPAMQWGLSTHEAGYCGELSYVLMLSKIHNLIMVIFQGVLWR